MKKAHYIALGVVLVFVVVLLKLPSRTASQVKLALGSLFLPLFGLVGSTQHWAEKGANAITPRKELLRQNNLLREENQQLRLRLSQVAESTRENERLRQLVGFPTQSAWNLKLGRVIARDPANWWRNLQINLGKEHGLRPDLPVLTADGLVGRTGEVSHNRAVVTLVGDPNCRVAALIQETRENGVILSGLSVLDTSFVVLGYLSKNSEVKPGHLVVTSGLGGIYPKGIPIGHVVDVRPVEFGLQGEARVKLLVDFDRLEEVWVVLSGN